MGKKEKEKRKKMTGQWMKGCWGNCWTAAFV